MDDDRSQHPLDDSPTTAEPEPEPAPLQRRSRGVGGPRHVISSLLALLAVPAAYGFLDYAAHRAIREAGQTAGVDQLPDNVMIAIAAGAACLFVAAAAGRISALGPLLAGIVWGVLPTVWVILDYGSFVSRLNDLPETYDFTGFGLASVCFALFPAVAGLLVGTAVAGRWRVVTVA